MPQNKPENNRWTNLPNPARNLRMSLLSTKLKPDRAIHYPVILGHIFQDMAIVIPRPNTRDNHNQTHAPQDWL